MQGSTQLILDEPTTGLDKGNRTVLHKVLDELIDDGKGLLIITHDTELISRYGKRVIHVKSGEVYC